MAIAVGVTAYLFFVKVMAYTGVYGGLEDVLMTGGTYFILLPVFILEVFPNEGTVRVCVGHSGINFSGGEVEGTGGTDL